MKLSAAQREKVQEQLGIESIPEQHPVIPDLKGAFGDHTFFLDAQGLNIVEPNPSSDGSNGNVVKIASWTKDGDSLQGHAPEVLSGTIEIQLNEPGPSA